MIRALRLLAVAGAAAALPGCVAAALPVLAGGAIATSGLRGDNEARTAPVGPPDTPRASIPNPPPGPIAPPASREAASPALAESPYGGFVAYALAEARPYLPDETRRSVVLADPGATRPDTRECDTQPPAVLIDLDDGDRSIDPRAVATIPTALVPGLAQLRARGLRIIWLSGAPSTQAANLRELLERSMLDPASRDLIALPIGGERKQVLRERLGREFCIEAMLGDRRADFDELYDYLRDESAAASLEPLIGNGWFLVPAPFGGGS
ncbi:hypothetical protein [Pseudoblastomonas halimionae]|uniref:Acid phosphatase n=1 Tax=Alteriqipengyuania halimionae TaxID=1926630 RepID=A0A6I4U8F7_9SPHN|nr:hypothetical protein [Alteriqipengyuania halimionae]MXP11085.1 hypothetical protein [Alteriqipengyuania halimionae]